MWPARQPVLESDRLLLRPYILDDAADVQRLAGDIRVAKETMNIPHPYKDGMAELWISSLAQKWRRKVRVEYAVLRKSDAVYTGGMSFVSVDGTEAEIGYWVGAPFWGNGYCTEAGKRLIEFGETELGLQKLTARHLSSNPASGKVLRNLGLTWRGQIRAPDRNDNSVALEVYEKTL